MLGTPLEETLGEEDPELVGALLEAAEIVETVEAGLREVLGVLLEGALDEEDPVLGAVLEGALDEEDPELLGVLLEAVEIVETLEVDPGGALDEMLDELLEVLLDEEGDELLNVLLATVELVKTLDTLLEVLLTKVEILELEETLDELLVVDDDELLLVDDDELEVELGLVYDVCKVLLADVDVATLIDVVDPGTETITCTDHINLLINPKSSRRNCTYTRRIPSRRIPNPDSRKTIAANKNTSAHPPSPISKNHTLQSIPIQKKIKKKKREQHTTPHDEPPDQEPAAAPAHRTNRSQRDTRAHL